MLKTMLCGTSLVFSALAFPALSGMIQDASRTPIDGAAIAAWDPATHKKVKASSSAGAFSFKDLEEGDYLFKVESDGRLPVFGAVHLSGDESRRILVVMLNAEPHGPVKAGAKSGLRLALNRPRPSAGPGRVTNARLLNKVAPVYPKSARRAGVSGTVKIATIIHPDGTLNDLVVLSAPHVDLAVAALLAVRQWRYSPTHLDGEPVESSVTIDVHFIRQ